MTKIHQYTELNGITQKQMCKETGISVSCMNRIIKYGTGTKSVKMLVYYHLRVQYNAQFDNAEYEQMLTETI